MPTHTNIHNFIAMYDKLCEDISLKTSNYKENCFAALLLFQKNIDHTLVYEKTISHIFIDWSHVKILPTYTLYKDPNSWITLLHFFDCVIDDAIWKTLRTKHRIFNNFTECLQNTVPNISRADTVKLFLLLNITNLEALCAFELFFAEISSENMRDAAFLFFSRLANETFDKNDRTTCLIYLLLHVIDVRSNDIVNEVEIMKKNRDMVRETLIQKNIRAIIKRPQLRSKLRDFDSVIDDSFKTWKDRIRFANCFSIVNAKRLYFLVAQTQFGIEEHVHSYVREEELRATLLANVVKKPDHATLTEVILQTRICSSPFPELHAFRDKGIASFSMVQKSRLRLNDLLHLYVAAYQVDWKTIWRSIIPILSSQIIHDVTDFTKEYAFNAKAVLEIMFATD